MHVDRLVDTNFLIARWRGGKDSAAASWLIANGGLAIGIPWIVKAEFLRGAAVAGHAREPVRALLDRYQTIWPDEESLDMYASTYASLRKQNAQIGPHDLWIAVAALRCGVPLVTRNSAEFVRIPGIVIEEY